MDVVPAAAALFALVLSGLTLAGMYIAYRSLHK